MAASYVTYPGDGVTTDFTFPFPYLSDADVFVFVNDAPVSFTFLNPNAIRLTVAAPAASAVRVQRTTQATSGQVNFTDGSPLLERDLDLSVSRSTYLGEEATDTANRGMLLNTQFQFDATSRRMINLAAGTSPTDAVNKSQLDTSVGVSSDIRDEAVSSAAAAAQSEANAADAAVQSESSAANAAVLVAELGDLQGVLAQSSADANLALQSSTDAALSAQAAAAAGTAKIYESWNNAGTNSLSGITGALNDTAIILSDAGTHTDPVLGTLQPNSGVFQYKTSAPVGWKRVGDTDAVIAASYHLVWVTGAPVPLGIYPAARFTPFVGKIRRLIYEVLGGTASIAVYINGSVAHAASNVTGSGSQDIDLTIPADASVDFYITSVAGATSIYAQIDSRRAA